MLIVEAGLGYQASIRTRRANHDGLVKVFQRPLLLAGDTCSTSNAVVHAAGDQDLADELFADAPVLRQTQ